MATEKKEVKKLGDKNRQEKISLKATDAHPQIKEGEIFEVHPAHKDSLLANKWAVEVDSDETKTKGKDGTAVPATSNVPVPAPEQKAKAK